MNKLSIKIVFTDLDGTLLNSQQKVSDKNLEMLHQLHDKKIVRVLVTGRNLYSLSKVITDDFPVDYVIFSTGVGIYDWNTKQLIHSTNLEEIQINTVANLLIDNNINFMLQREVPDNHKFHYLKHGHIGADFQRRIDIYYEFAEAVCEMKIKIASQFLAIFEDLETFHQIKNQLVGVEIVRATSPLDHKSIWMEIFHQDVSKGKGCHWLCNHLSIDRKYTLSLGNDYNDLDMLNWTKYSFVVENSTGDLKEKFPVTKHYDKNAFAETLKKFV